MPSSTGAGTWAGRTIFEKPVRSYVERILRLQEEQDDLSAAIRAIYTEAQNDGLDGTTLRQLVTYIGKKEKDPDRLAEGEEMFDLYLAAYKGFHAHAAAQGTDAPIRETDTTGVIWTAGEMAGEGVGHGAAAQRFAGERILIVEDEPVVAAHLASEIAAASGKPVGPASSVTDAIRLLQEGKIDGAILDMRLADGDASPIASELTERSLPFVILSGVEMSQQQQHQRPNVPDFRKPVIESEPVSALAEQIRKRARQS